MWVRKDFLKGLLQGRERVSYCDREINALIIKSENMSKVRQKELFKTSWHTMLY